MPNDPQIIISQLSEHCILCQSLFGVSVQAASDVKRIVASAQLLHPLPAELTPSYNSVMLRFSEPVRLAEVSGKLNMLYAQTTIGEDEDLNSNLIEIPICFDEELANDKALISHKTGLTLNDLVTSFIDHTYYVFAIGFLPGFPYMGILPENLRVPRFSNTRNIEAGAVAIADAQVGIYPVNTPGGWHVMGYTPLKMFDVNNASSPSLLRAGYSVRFVPVEFDIYLKMLS